MTRNGRPLSMADVAELVGVSHQTVSRVVNGKGRVSPRTRERVQAAIDQLGYRPNSVARALVTARSGIIGVVTTTSAHFGPSSMLVALEVAAREAGLFTSVVALDRFGADDVASAFDHFSSLAAEAIVVIAPVDSLAEAVASQGASVPVVAVSGGRTFGRGVSVVHADQRGGARALARPRRHTPLAVHNARHRLMRDTDQFGHVRHRRRTTIARHTGLPPACLRLCSHRKRQGPVTYHSPHFLNNS